MSANLHPIDKAAKHLSLSLEGLGSILGVTKGAVSQWKLGGREIPVEHCVSIMKATNNFVTREEMRPDDFWLIWPDLEAPRNHRHRRRTKPPPSPADIAQVATEIVAEGH